MQIQQLTKDQFNSNKILIHIMDSSFKVGRVTKIKVLQLIKSIRDFYIYYVVFNFHELTQIRLKVL